LYFYIDQEISPEEFCSTILEDPEVLLNSRAEGPIQGFGLNEWQI